MHALQPCDLLFVILPRLFQCSQVEVAQSDQNVRKQSYNEFKPMNLLRQNAIVKIFRAVLRVCFFHCENHITMQELFRATNLRISSCSSKSRPAASFACSFDCVRTTSSLAAYDSRMLSTSRSFRCRISANERCRSWNIGRAVEGTAKLHGTNIRRPHAFFKSAFRCRRASAQFANVQFQLVLVCATNTSSGLHRMPGSSSRRSGLNGVV